MSTEPTLAERREALGRAVDLAAGRLDEAVLGKAGRTLTRLAERAEIAPDRTVVALIGTTGSGKSTIFNRLTGAPHARVSATRPTTREPLAVCGPGAGELLDWLGIENRIEQPDGGSGLVLLDLPDIDSTERSHRAIAERLAEVVDVLIWVADPQKYADAILHDQFLRPLAANADVMAVALNKIDLLDPNAISPVLGDLRALLANDGIRTMAIVPTSAKTGVGMEDLQRLVVDAARTKLALHQRARGEVIRAATQVRGAARGAPAVAEDIDQSSIEQLTTASANAAGVRAITEAAEQAYIRRARSEIGWFPVRWVARRRPDPLRALHLNREAAEPGLGVTSLPAPTAVQEAAVRSAAHELVTDATRDLPDQWRASVVDGARATIPELVRSLDNRLADVNLDFRNWKRPTWWRVFGTLQTIVFVIALWGLLWLAAIAILGFLQIQLPATPMLGPVPLPTLLLIGGIILGAFMGWRAMVTAEGAASANATWVAEDLHETVAETVEEVVVAPLRSELEDYRLFRDSLEIALRE